MYKWEVKVSVFVSYFYIEIDVIFVLIKQKQQILLKITFNCLDRKKRVFTLDWGEYGLKDISRKVEEIGKFVNHKLYSPPGNAN